MYHVICNLRFRNNVWLHIEPLHVTFTLYSLIKTCSMHVMSSFSMQVIFDTLNFSVCDTFIYMLIKWLKSYMLAYCLELYECVWLCNISFVQPTFKWCAFFMYSYSYEGLFLFSSLILVYFLMFSSLFEQGNVSKYCSWPKLEWSVNAFNVVL